MRPLKVISDLGIIVGIAGAKRKHEDTRLLFPGLLNNYVFLCGGDYPLSKRTKTKIMNPILLFSQKELEIFTVNCNILSRHERKLYIESSNKE